MIVNRKNVKYNLDNESKKDKEKVEKYSSMESIGKKEGWGTRFPGGGGGKRHARYVLI